MNAKSIIILAMASGLALNAYAQAPKQPVPLRAIVGDITDNRTTGSFNSECKVELKFTGDTAADASSVRKVRVSKALDELGRDLVAKEESDSSFGSSSRSGTLKAEVKLRNPSRNATVIKVIEGEVELFNPTVENGGILSVKDILKKPAEPIQHKGLQKYGIEVIYLTKESYEAKKKEIEEKQKSQPGAAIGEAFGELFKGMFGGMMGSDSPNSVKLYVKDPQKRVVDMEFQGADGRPLKRRGSWSSSEMRNYDFESKVPQDAQLMIHVATPEATQTFPFKVENVPLP